MDPHRMGRTLTLNHHPRAAATRRGQTHISAANPNFWTPLCPHFYSDRPLADWVA